MSRGVLARAKNPRRDETRQPRRVGTRFEGVFLPGGSFNAITRATPGASPPCLCSPPSLPLNLFPPCYPRHPPLALSSFAVATTLTTATHHFLAHEPTLARTLSLSVFHPFALLPLFLLFLSSSSPPRTAPSPRTSFRIIFILSSAILVNAIPPAVRETFFILRLNILSRYRAVETSRLEGRGRGWEERGRHPGTHDGIALCFRAIKILSASPSTGVA